MLEITSSAAEAIRGLTSAIPHAAGIRLAARPGPSMNGSGPTHGFEAQPAAAPDESDAVLRGDEADVFIDPALVPHLDDKVLDAELDGPSTTFVLREQD